MEILASIVFLGSYILYLSVVLSKIVRVQMCVQNCVSVIVPQQLCFRNLLCRANLSCFTMEAAAKVIKICADLSAEKISQQEARAQIIVEMDKGKKQLDGPKQRCCGTHVNC